VTSSRPDIGMVVESFSTDRHRSVGKQTLCTFKLMVMCKDMLTFR